MIRPIPPATVIQCYVSRDGKFTGVCLSCVISANDEICNVLFSQAMISIINILCINNDTVGGIDVYYSAYFVTGCLEQNTNNIYFYLL